MAYNREKKRDETKMKELRRVPIITQMKTSKILKIKKPNNLTFDRHYIPFHVETTNVRSPLMNWTGVLEHLPLHIFMLIRPFELPTDSQDSRAYFIRRFK